LLESDLLLESRLDPLLESRNVTTAFALLHVDESPKDASASISLYARVALRLKARSNFRDLANNTRK